MHRLWPCKNRSLEIHPWNGPVLQIDPFHDCNESIGCEVRRTGGPSGASADWPGGKHPAWTRKNPGTVDRGDIASGGGADGECDRRELEKPGGFRGGLPLPCLAQRSVHTSSAPPLPASGLLPAPSVLKLLPFGQSFPAPGAGAVMAICDGRNIRSLRRPKTFEEREANVPGKPGTKPILNTCIPHEEEVRQ